MLKTKLLASSILLALVNPAFAEPKLEEGFKNPPQSARPRVWWHWMSGNVTEEGIKLDLEWMKRVGIGGVQTFDADLATPKVVAHPLAYMTPAWKHAFRFAAQTADRLGLELAIASSPGWSESGGPWVKPEDAMKKLVWSEATIAGGAPVHVTLAAPPSNAGPYQDAAITPGIGEAHAPEFDPFYRDVAVIAYRSRDTALPQPKVSTGGGAIDAAALFDGKLATGIALVPGTEASPAYLRFDYDTPQVIRAASVAMPPASMFGVANYQATLEASADGQTFAKIADIPSGSSPQYTVGFAPVTAKALRIMFRATSPGAFSIPGKPAAGVVFPTLPGLGFSGPQSIKVFEVSFSAAPRVHHAEDKAGFAVAADYYAIPSPESTGVARTDVVDVTSKLAPDGTLNWSPPVGNWRVLRIGYTLTGTQNHPAPAEATGLEVDKFDRTAVQRYITHYLDTYDAAAGKDMIGAHGVRGLLNDSTEVGPSNWTPMLAAEFKTRRGYDLTPWLPALTGVVIDSAAKTDAFLYDYRKTLAELMTEAHYRTITAEAHRRGLIHYSEALESGRPSLGDDMAMRAGADIPMAAMWSYPPEAGGPAPDYYVDIRGAASVAHIYGQNLVAAESLTSALNPWAFSPRDLQPMIDMEFALGVNRPVIHTSVHQPLTDHAPGFSLFIFGQYFNRLDTWGEQAKPWVDYISRNAFMLQQGRFVADVGYFYGEEAPLTALGHDKVPTDTPTKNGFDYMNADVLLNMLSVEPASSDLVATSGARYKLLYLGGSSSRMSLQVLRRLDALVQGGARVVGEKPVGSPALMDDPVAFSALADALWGGKTGKGKVLASHDINAALTTLGVAPDFDYKAENADAKLMFVHRKTPRAEIYYFTNRKDRAEDLKLVFPASDKVVKYLDASTGAAHDVFSETSSGQTRVSMTLRPYQSGYIVFGDNWVKPTLQSAKTISRLGKAEPKFPMMTPLPNKWRLTFQPNRGAPVGTIPVTLGDLSTSANPAIKYFSGTASYARSLNIKPAWLKPHAHLVLDLGEVHELAEVVINGKSAGIAWKAPYALDVTTFVHAGTNKLEVKVTNLWVNRLIGDAQPSVTHKITFTTMPTYTAGAPLRPSGLIGPVVLRDGDELAPASLDQ
jgi:hypothetical protein